MDNDGSCEDVEIGINFGGYTRLSNDMNFGQIKIGLPEIGKLVTIKKDGFFGKFLDNLNPSISMGKQFQNVPVLKGTISKINKESILGSFDFGGYKVNFLRIDWIDYIQF